MCYRVIKGFVGYRDTDNADSADDEDRRTLSRQKKRKEKAVRAQDRLVSPYKVRDSTSLNDMSVRRKDTSQLPLFPQLLASTAIGFT